MLRKIINYFAVQKIRKKKEKTKYNKILWDAEKPLIEMQNQIDEEKKEAFNKHKQLKRPTWSKALLAILTVNFILLEVFIGWITVKSFSLALMTGVMPDFTPLVTLIGVVAGHTVSYWIYSAKSKAENTEGGITYEMAKWQMEQNMYENDMYGGGCG